jgi:RNA recognition motif-containing protein
MTDPDTRKLFVAGLSDGVGEVELRRMFEAAGASVEEVAVPRDRQTGKARGFGFITLASEDQAEQVRDALDGSLHDGRPISVRPFRGNRPTSQSPPPRGGPMDAPMRSSSSFVGGGSSGGSGGSPEERDNTLFLANLPSDCREDELADIFREAGVGPILKLHLPVDPDGRRRGFGFISLRDGAAAREAVPKLREHSLRGRPLTVDVARPRGERPGGVGGGPGGPPPGGAGAWRSRPPPPRGSGDAGGPPMRSFPSDGGGGPPPVERQTWDERRDPSKRKKPAEAAPKKKKARAADRGHSRRENEGFRAPRARGMMDDWDEE